MEIDWLFIAVVTALASKKAAAIWIEPAVFASVLTFLMHILHCTEAGTRNERFLKFSGIYLLYNDLTVDANIRRG